MKAIDTKYYTCWVGDTSWISLLSDFITDVHEYTTSMTEGVPMFKTALSFFLRLHTGQDGNFKGGSMWVVHFTYMSAFKVQYLRDCYSLSTVHSYLNWGSSGDVDILCPVCSASFSCSPSLPSTSQDSSSALHHPLPHHLFHFLCACRGWDTTRHISHLWF